MFGIGLMESRRNSRLKFVWEFVLQFGQYEIIEMIWCLIELPNHFFAGYSVNTHVVLTFSHGVAETYGY
jgi:hypothetical protein